MEDNTYDDKTSEITDYKKAIQVIDHDIRQLLRGDNLDELEDYIDSNNIDPSLVATLARYEYLIDPSFEVASSVLDEDEENLQWVLELAIHEDQWYAIEYCLSKLKDVLEDEPFLDTFGQWANRLSDEDFDKLTEILDLVDQIALECDYSASYSNDSDSDSNSCEYDRNLYYTHTWRIAIMENNDYRDLDDWLTDS